MRRTQIYVYLGGCKHFAFSPRTLGISNYIVEYFLEWGLKPPSRILLENHICFRVQIFQPGLPWSSSTPVVSHKSHESQEIKKVNSPMNTILPEAKSPHLKQWGWFRWVSFSGPGLLPGAVLISFGECRWFCIHFEEFLLLMEEILHHLGWKKTLYFYQDVIRKTWCFFWGVASLFLGSEGDRFSSCSWLDPSPKHWSSDKHVEQIHSLGVWIDDLLTFSTMVGPIFVLVGSVPGGRVYKNSWGDYLLFFQMV